MFFPTGPVSRFVPNELNKEAYEDALLLAADSMAKASTPEPFSTSTTSNWVARAGGLPPYIQHVAHALMPPRGHLDESAAIGEAVGIVKNWADGHDGKGKAVHPDTQAAAKKAIAEWEAKKAASHVNASIEWDTEIDPEAFLAAVEELRLDFAEDMHPRGPDGKWIAKLGDDISGLRVGESHSTKGFTATRTSDDGMLSDIKVRSPDGEEFTQSGRNGRVEHSVAKAIGRRAIRVPPPKPLSTAPKSFKQDDHVVVDDPGNVLHGETGRISGTAGDGTYRVELGYGGGGHYTLPASSIKHK